jgi:2-polyprenyl-6-methoxyphenol hydroxylase-like FAD-dependent oxidoreductase
MSHKQPVLEEHLRAATNKSLGEMKTSSTLSAIREDDKHVMVDYHDEEGNLHTIRAQFLVGADGKTGFVRKKYLEPMGVVMENSPK